MSGSLQRAAHTLHYTNMTQNKLEIANQFGTNVSSENNKGELIINARGKIRNVFVPDESKSKPKAPFGLVDPPNLDRWFAEEVSHGRTQIIPAVPLNERTEQPVEAIESEDEKWQQALEVLKPIVPSIKFEVISEHIRKNLDLETFLHLIELVKQIKGSLEHGVSKLFQGGSAEVNSKRLIKGAESMQNRVDFYAKYLQPFNLRTLYNLFMYYGSANEAFVAHIVSPPEKDLFVLLGKLAYEKSRIVDYTLFLNFKPEGQEIKKELAKFLCNPDITNESKEILLMMVCKLVFEQDLPEPDAIPDPKYSKYRLSQVRFTYDENVLANSFFSIKKVSVVN